MSEQSLIVFDVETNGFAGSSVLSLSAVKAVLKKEEEKLEVIDTYERYYYIRPGEKPNLYALAVNRLYDDEVDRRRKGQSYSSYFKDDVEDFADFCQDARLFVAHNMAFDRSFIPFLKGNKNLFCTMQANKAIKYGKSPKLFEAADFYGIAVDDDELHSSLYDARLCFEIFKAMYEQGHQKVRGIFEN